MLHFFQRSIGEVATNGYDLCSVGNDYINQYDDTDANTQELYHEIEGENNLYCSECPICYQCTHIVSITPCKHQFCLKCYHKFKSESNHNSLITCPYCRTDIHLNMFEFELNITAETVKINSDLPFMASIYACRGVGVDSFHFEDM